MSKSPIKKKIEEAPAAQKTYKITPNNVSEYVDAGFSVAHISDDGLIFVLKKGHSFVRITHEASRDAATGATRISVSSVAKIP